MKRTFVAILCIAVAITGCASKVVMHQETPEFSSFKKSQDTIIGTFVDKPIRTFLEAHPTKVVNQHVIPDGEGGSLYTIYVDAPVYSKVINRYTQNHNGFMVVEYERLTYSLFVDINGILRKVVDTRSVIRTATLRDEELENLRLVIMGGVFIATGIIVAMTSNTLQ